MVLIQASPFKKMQGKISTKNEIIGVYESLPQALWFKLFLESQGYTIEHNIIYQDKKVLSYYKPMDAGLAQAGQNTPRLDNSTLKIMWTKAA